MSNAEAAARAIGWDADQHAEPEQKVTPLELFFDLVFVFGLTQVTAALAANPTWEGLARGVLVLAALWWTWTGYAWLTNRVASDDGPARLVLFCAMAATLVMALAVPGAFDDEAVAFAIAYLVVRQLQSVALWRLGDDDPDVHVAVARLAVTSIVGPVLVLVATGFDGATQGALWAVAILIDFAGGRLATRGERGVWRIHAGHFAERHALIVIIALGESIVALGVGAEELHIGVGVVTACVLGIALVAALWWAYFDVVALVAERRLARAEGAERGEIARDSYSYLHFLMVAGIVLLALGIKKTLGDYDEPLKAMPAVCLCGGAALYYVGHILFRLRNVRSLSRSRSAATVALLATIPLATEVDALVALGVVAAIAVATVAYEAVRYAEARARIRHAIT
ncbi:low temperature requirement protein A [Conexibacter sp. SYSU D00693]|uniref:low temperature requirement protein A n=1 Tax=Conexibacter sp. SYSU D00693 TaxID=2812560 RepID=UPI00196B698F|nr:low temperature requirement protein A [Conexibacter sp. SYSU D00693]